MFRIPSVQTLRVLDACFRLNSFTRAAEELGISQGAVSQQIKSLEQRLGFAVFIRHGRTISPTESGKQLVQAVRQGFGQIADVIAHEQRRQRDDSLVISALPGFASRWLFPRLMSFEQAHPELTLTVNAISNPLDFSLHHAHGAINYAATETLSGAGLFTEQLFPVCSPAFAAQHQLSPQMSDQALAEQLQQLPLLLDSSPTAAPWRDSWACWADQLGVTLPADEGRRYSQSNMTLQLAELGHGIALGRSSLVMDAIASGRLIALGDIRASNPCSYQLVENPALPAGDAYRAFSHWLSQQTDSIAAFDNSLRTSIRGC